ncbi:hypothetical protein NHX12_011720 [Muraenolepis orangiensis]|uniref:Uncharacterized protein n=1 Tax=Muraenolepis orangiensis TaxID=630683 RepID=A0A9Q0DC54_9TELE|nr:hypothetical protein NHX12_015374 [Muraenolepis orangiensis]KAJ3588125.1 hypothetical protein NHX12_011720 [Muraenolepis orangiensis]
MPSPVPLAPAVCLREECPPLSHWLQQSVSERNALPCPIGSSSLSQRGMPSPVPLAPAVCLSERNALPCPIGSSSLSQRGMHSPVPLAPAVCLREECTPLCAMQAG